MDKKICRFNFQNIKYNQTKVTNGIVSYFLWLDEEVISFLLYVLEVEHFRREYLVVLMELIINKEKNLNGVIFGVLVLEFLINIENKEEVDVVSGDILQLYLLLF